MMHLRDDAMRAYQRALAINPDLIAADFNIGVILHEQGRTDAAIDAFEQVIARNPRHVPAHKALGDTLLAARRIDDWLRVFERFEASCPRALPLAVQALEVYQYRGDFAGLDRYLDRLRQDDFKPENETDLADCLEQLLFLLLYFDIEPQAQLGLYRTYDAVAQRVYGKPLALAPVRRPGRLRIGYLSGDLRNHVMGKMMWAGDPAPRSRALRALLLFAVRGQRRVDAALSRIRRPFRDGRRPDRARSGAPHRRRRPRSAGGPVDPHQGRQARHSRPQAGKGADHPCRERRRRGPQRHRLQADRRFRRHAGEPGVPDREAAADGRLRLSVSAHRARRRSSVPSRPAQDSRRRRRHRRIREPAEALPALPFALARGAGARAAHGAGDLAVVARGARRVQPAPVGGEHLAPARHRPAAGAQRRREPGALHASSTSRSTRCRTAASTARSKRSTWASRSSPCAAKSTASARSYSILENLGVRQTIAASGSEYVDIAVRLATDAAFVAEVRAAIGSGLGHSTLVDMPRHTRALEAAYEEAIVRAQSGAAS